MATVNFGVPDDVKAAFDAACAGENKSAVLAGLMREALERKRRAQRRARAVAALLVPGAIRRARMKDRP
jgi:hypothetical protein